MKEIYLLLKVHLKEDYNPRLYLYFLSFLTVTISLNYYFDFEDGILDSYYTQPISFITYTLFYMFAYYGIAIPQLFLNNKSSVLKSWRYWARSSFFISIVGFAAYFYFHRKMVFESLTAYENNFVLDIVRQLNCWVTIIFPLLIFWLVFDKNKRHFYGFNLKNANLKAYFQMLLIMFPLVFAASFLSDFQDNYPIMKAWDLNSPFGWNNSIYYLIFEPLYGISFLSVELVFRGALVIGMIKLLGKEAVLPMVSMYAFLHFGKPLGETIGSVFGGYILGVIALKKKHIFGGFILHVGVAYLMEITALWQHYYN